MRTKTLLVTVALAAMGLANSFGQGGVYSVNAVGYVNVSVPTSSEGVLSMLANPLEGTNQNIGTILPLPLENDGTTVFTYDVTVQNYVANTFVDPSGWANPAMELPPGTGFFIKGFNFYEEAKPIALTFVGQVMQGHLVKDLPENPNLAMIGSQVPQEARLGYPADTASLRWPADDGDTVFRWEGGTYAPYTAIDNGDGTFGWSPSDPTIKVAEGFFIKKGPGAVSLQWIRDFDVNNP